ncbi:MAG TPA: FtsX-like permease family protein [Burkholderiaceae bacterium]|jgi:putative ABC transport system permease protein|nr:FtsX-like permease family protein [Burkholderiaceae bacterium]
MEFRPILSALLRNKIAPLLVALQVAISLAILANALHIVNLRYEAATRPSGIANEHDTFVIQMASLKTPSFADSIAQQKRDREALLAMPGVTSAATVSQVPMGRSGWNTAVVIDRNQVHTTSVSLYMSPDSLVQAMGLELVAGRYFTANDVEEIDFETSDINPKIVVITQALAKALFPDVANVVGKKIFFGTGNEAKEAQIIGVVRCMQTQSAQTSREGEYSAILPIRPEDRYAQFIVQTEAGQRDRVMGDAETQLRKVTPYPVVAKLRSIDEIRATRYRDDRILGWMLIVVSAMLLLVTASGIVGMTSLWVSQRRKQIGVRRALGARRVDILRYFITENLLITSGGVVGGLILAVALNQFLVSQLEMSKLPIAYLAIGAAVFWLLGVFAVYGPAWRAASISPAVATRTA